MLYSLDCSGELVCVCAEVVSFYTLVGCLGWVVCFLVMRYACVALLCCVRLYVTLLGFVTSFVVLVDVVSL